MRRSGILHNNYPYSCIFFRFLLVYSPKMNNFAAAKEKDRSQTEYSYGRNFGSKGAGTGCCPLLW